MKTMMKAVLALVFGATVGSSAWAAVVPQPEETGDSKMHLAYVAGHADTAVIRNYYYGTGGSEGYQFNFRNAVTGSGVSAVTTTTGSIANGSTGLTTVTATGATGTGKVTIQRAKYQNDISRIGTYKDDCIYNTASRVQRVVYVGQTAKAYGFFQISINDTAETGTTGSWKTPVAANGLVTVKNVAGVSSEHNFVSVTGVSVGWEQVTSEFMTDSPHNPPQPEGVTYTFNFQVRDTPAVFGTIPDQQINFNTKLSTIDLNTLGIVMKDSNGTVVTGEFVWDNPDKTWTARETTVETATFTATGANAEFYDPVTVEVTIVAGQPKEPQDGTFGDSILVTTGTRELTDVPFVWTSWKVMGDDIGVTVETAPSGYPLVKAGAQAGKTVVWIESDDYYRVYEVKVYETKAIDVEGYKNSTKRVKLTSAAEAVWTAHSDDESIATVSMGSSEASANAEATVVCKGDDGDTVTLTVQNDYVVYTVNVTVKGEKQPETGKFNLAAGETAVMSLYYGGNSPAERCYRVNKTEDGISVNRDFAENKNQKTLNLTFTGLQDDGSATVEIQQRQSYDSGTFAAYSGNYITTAVAQPKRIMYLGDTKQLYCLSSEAATWKAVPANDGIVSVTAPSGAVAEGYATVKGEKVGTTTFTIGNTTEVKTGFFKGVTYTINYEVRGMPYASGALTGDQELETGAMLSTIGVAGAMTNALGEAVGGTFAWVNGNQTFDTDGTKTVEAIFTPTNPSYDSVKVEVQVTVSRPCVKVPTAKLGLVYDGTCKTGVVATEGCAVTGNVATNAGTYTAKATLTGDLAWPDGSKDPTNITWTIARKSVTVTANATNKVYGATEPTLTATVTGLVNGESEDLITYTLSRESGDDVGTYDIFVTVDDADQGNYTVSGDTATDAFEITRAPIEKPTAESKTLVYNGGCVTGVVAKTGFTMADNVATNAGTYTATATLDGNHMWTGGSTDAATVDFTIAPAEIAVAADNKTVKLDAPAPEYTYTVTPELFGDDALEGSLACDYDPNSGTNAVGMVFDILQGTLTNANYVITSFTKGTLTIASLQVTLSPAGRTYDGTAFPSNSITFTVTDNDGQEVTDFVVAGTNSMLDAGTYTFKVTTADGLEGSADFVVTQKTVTVTANADTKTYGDADPTFTAAVSGTIGSDTVSYTVSRATGENVGEYQITASGNESQGNYKVEFVPATFTITPKAVTVRADNTTKTYGEGVAFTATVTGTNGTDGATIAFGFNCDTGSVANVGSYVIKPVSIKSGYTSNVETQGNYAVTYDWSDDTAGKLVITPKSVTVTSVSTNMFYGDIYPITSTVTGLVYGDTLDYELGPVDCNGDVGEYAIGVISYNTNNNYTVDFNLTGCTLTIERRPVFVTVVATNKVYGAEDPAFTYVVSNAERTAELTVLPNGTDVVLSGELERIAGEDVKDSPYDIEDGTLTNENNPNYIVSNDVVFVDGENKFTILSAPLTVAADDKTKVYGDSDPTLTATVKGLVNGDTEESLGLVYSLDRATGEGAGTYAITPTGTTPQGGEYGKNYDIAYSNGTFTITKAILTVTPKDTTVAFGATPAYGYTLSGFKRGDTAATAGVSGAPTYSCTYAGVGTYPISISTVGNLDAANYTFAAGSATATLTVTKSEDPLIPAGGDEPGSGAVPEGGKSKFDLFKMYDGEGFTLDCAAISNAYATMTLGAYSVTSASAPVTNAGTYTVSYTVTSANYPDYTHEAQLTVTNRPVTLTSADGGFAYDGQAHSNTTVTVGGAGFVAGEGVTTNNFATITEKGSCPNSFGYQLVLKPGSIEANYLVTCVTGTLTVAEAVNSWEVAPTVTSKTYDGTPAEYTLGTPEHGTVTVTYDGGQTAAPVDAGAHTATFAVAGTADYTGLTTNIAYTISAKALAVTMAEEIPAQRWAHDAEIKPTTTLADGELMTSGDYAITGWESNVDPGTGYVVVEGRGNYTGTIKVPFKILSVEETAILETFGDCAEISYDDQADVLTLKLTNDLEGAVKILDNLGDVVLDLNGHKIIGKDGDDETEIDPATDGEPAIRIVSAKEEGSKERGVPTSLQVVDESGEPADPGLAGGNGGAGAKGGAGGNGGAGVEVDAGARAGVEVEIDGSVNAQGGDGGAGDPDGEDGQLIVNPQSDVDTFIEVDDAEGVAEGTNIVITVTGGNAELSSSVQLQAVYGTATAADLDLKNATVDGAPVSGFKFPYTLTWEAGEICSREIQIPVKSQSKAKQTRDLTFELQNPKNLKLKGVDDGQPENESFKRVWIRGGLGPVAGKVYVRATPNDATRGKTSGSALVVSGKKVTVKATALTGYAFTGWYKDGALVERAASYAFEATANVELMANFEPLAADYLVLNDFLPANVVVSVPYSNTLDAAIVESGSLPTVSVSGLPSGLKFYAKETVIKATKTTPEYKVPANTIFGTPTKASAKPSNVKVTVKNLGGYKIVRTYAVVVSAEGTPSGLAAVVKDEVPFFAVSASLSDDAAGKVTGAKLYQAGKKVTMKATANKGYVFAGWLDENGETKFATASYSFTMPSNNVSLVAKFALPDEIKDPTGKNPYGVAVVRNDDFAGNVTGAGYYQAGKKVTLKATANKGYVFSGWYDETGKTRLTQEASYVIASMPAKDVRYTAVFVTAGEDLASVATAMNGMSLKPTEKGVACLATNVMCGVALQWPVAAEALSLPKVAVSGLPSGLKFTAKPVTAKVNGQTVTNVPANTIYGAPTAASKAGKPSAVKVTVTTSGKSKVEYQITLTVNPLPDYAVGTFDGYAVADDGSTNGVVKFTVAASGKISGTIQTNCANAAAKKLSLSAASFADYDLETKVFALKPTYKDGKATVEISLELAGVDVAEEGVTVGVIDGESLAAYQNVLKGAAAEAFVAPERSDLVLTVAKDGVLKFAGTVDSVKVSGSSQIYYDADEGGFRAVIYAPSKTGFDGIAEIIEIDTKDN